ncbi:hypothetical protein [Immundisolibacter sp.]
MTAIDQTIGRAVYYGSSEGFTWELHFDTADGFFKIETNNFFNTPLEAKSDVDEFCHVNRFSKKDDWEELK